MAADAQLTDVVVIGGGVTGCAVARDAALRGLSVTLVEQGDLGAGTSGRFHGMLQSGARYVTTDVGYAAQCMRERRTFERIAAQAMDATGGLFVVLGSDPPGFEEVFERGCAEADIPTRRLSSEEVAAREPRVRGVVAAFEVPDAVFRPWSVVVALAEDAHTRGAAIRLHARVTRIDADGERCAVVVQRRDGSVDVLRARTVTIAAGPWAPSLVPTGGATPSMQLAKGSMLVLPERLVGAVVNRCRPPGGFDILVPFGATTIFGTTSLDVDDPTTRSVQPDEERDLRDGARALLGRDALDAYGGLTTYAGVRPLVVSATDTDGAVSRRHLAFEHPGLPVITIVGGSFTTHRAMAEDVVDRVCRRLGVDVACTTAQTPLPRSSGAFAWSRDAFFQPAAGAPWAS